ncbi:unnamed protein product [Urochloa humidicola]
MLQIYHLESLRQRYKMAIRRGRDNGGQHCIGILGENVPKIAVVMRWGNQAHSRPTAVSMVPPPDPQPSQLHSL